MSLFDRHRNADGTYNGISMFAEITGFSIEEVEWIANRTRELKAEGCSREEATRIINEEAKGRPWESA